MPAKNLSLDNVNNMLYNILSNTKYIESDS